MAVSSVKEFIFLHLQLNIKYMNDFENDLMHKNPDNWKWIFYVNSKDPRVLVPKLNPAMGWTLNFGHKYAYIGLTLIIAIVLATKFLL